MIPAEVTLLDPKTYQSTPWKNGKGKTQQILIEPSHANFSEDPFVYRLSIAPILENGMLSRFPGYQRILTLLKGESLKLEHQLKDLGTDSHYVKKNEIYVYDGSLETEALLPDGPVQDLGMIFDPKKVSVTARFGLAGDLAQASTPHLRIALLLQSPFPGWVMPAGTQVQGLEVASKVVIFTIHQ